MKSSQLLIAVLMSISIESAYAGLPKTFSEWEACRDKAQQSVDFEEEGNLGIESTIKEKCGIPLAKEPAIAGNIVGMSPYDLVKSKAYKDKFTKITKNKYKQLAERLTVASNTEKNGDWIVGEGIMPHSGGIEEAAVAINTKTRKVYAVMMENGKQFSYFGFSNTQSEPQYLLTWVNDRK